MASRSLAISLLCLSIAACGSAPRISADTPADLQKGLTRYIALGEGATREQRRDLAAKLTELYLKDGKWRELPEGVPPASIFDRMRISDVTYYAHKALFKQLERTSPPLIESTRDRSSLDSDAVVLRWRNQFMADQLADQRDLLLARKEKSRFSDLFTIDQLNFSEATFLPPQPGMPVGQDKATFTLKFHNATAFNLYRPAFHIRVDDSKQSYPILDVNLKYQSDEPVAPGQVREVTVACCDSYTDPLTNGQLRTLGVDASIAMQLVSIEDYGKKNLIQNSLFTADEQLKLVATEQCLKDVTERIDTWTAKTEVPACKDV